MIELEKDCNRKYPKWNTKRRKMNRVPASGGTKSTCNGGHRRGTGETGEMFEETVAKHVSNFMKTINPLNPRSSPNPR